MELTSPVFKHQEMIPSIYTCDGKSISPQLEWEDLPAAVQSLALIMDDPDASSGTFVHWVIFNISPSLNGLDENIPKQQDVLDGAVQGINSSGKTGYTGPCPPSGTHRYFFKLYALDQLLNLSGKVRKEDLLEAMQGNILDQAQLIGLYKRSR